MFASNVSQDDVEGQVECFLETLPTSDAHEAIWGEKLSHGAIGYHLIWEHTLWLFNIAMV